MDGFPLSKFSVASLGLALKQKRGNQNLFSKGVRSSLACEWLLITFRELTGLVCAKLSNNFDK